MVVDHPIPARGGKLLSVPSVKKVLLSLTGALWVSVSIAGQEWTGRVGGAYVWQDASGNEDSFLTQYNLQSGFNLEDLLVDFVGAGGLEKMKIEAQGFGAAFPTATARVGFEFRPGLELDLGYDRRRSFFRLAGSDLALRSDDWDLSRWRGALVIDTWEPLKTSIILRHYEIDGVSNRTLFGLNELYPIGVDLDESMNEGTLRLETRTLPVQIDFEQSFTRYERKNNYFPIGGEALTGPDPDLLSNTEMDIDDTQTGPTTRLTVSYAESWFQALGTVLYSDFELDSAGAGANTFAVGGGSIGTISFVDELMGSAQNENLFAAMNLGFMLPRGWVVRVAAETRDATTDAALFGQRLVRATSPLGSPVEFGAGVSDDGLYESEDTRVRARLEYRQRTWSVWGGVSGASRDVAWRQTAADSLFQAERTSGAFLVGASVTPGRYLDLNIEYSQGDFTNFIFRTDPETVERAVFKLRSDLGGGWQLWAHGRYEKGRNPVDIASVDFRSAPYGVAASWTSAAGASSATLDLNRLTIETETGLVLPTGEPGVSLYDLDLTTATIHGQTRAGIVKFRGSGTYVVDDGSTWPLQSWYVVARVTLEGPAGLEYGVFAGRWSYDEDRTDVDDYDVNRGGLTLAWSF